MNISHSSENFSFQRISSPKCDVEIHIHDTYEIYQALSGNIKYFIEGNCYKLNIGDIIITNTKEVHRPTTINESVYERRFIQFQPEIFEFFFDNFNPLAIFDSRPKGTHNCFQVNNNSTINQLFNRIELCSDDAVGKLEIKALLIQLFIELYKQYDDKKILEGQIIDPRILRVKEDLDNHFTHDFTLDQFSKKHYMDKYYLSHLFKEVTGFTILEYIHSKRIQFAKQLIKENKQMTEVAHLCGFNDYSNFYRAFKKITNYSPKDYKNTNKSDA